MSLKLSTQAAKLALVCLTVIAFQSAEMGLGKRHHTHHHKQEDDLMLDAFDMDKCGQVNSRPWQDEQSAYGCANDSNNSDSNEMGDTKGQDGRVPFDGEPSKDGEFPFLVQVSMIGSAFKIDHRWDCTGVLVHKDIVIATGADCIRPEGMRLDSVGLGIGSDVNHNPLKGMTKTKARVVCSFSPNDTMDYDTAVDDLAVIRLNEPIDYKPGKIQPACLSLDFPDRQSNDTTCTLIGNCAPLDSKLPSRPFYRWKFGKGHLRTMSLRRDICPTSESGQKIPHETCYRPQNGAGRCRGTQGNPVVCYDKCSKQHPDRVQAHVVGLLSQRGKPVTADYEPISVIDLHKGRERLMELLRAVRIDWRDDRHYRNDYQYSDNITCWLLYNGR